MGANDWETAVPTIDQTSKLTLSFLFLILNACDSKPSEISLTQSSTVLCPWSRDHLAFTNTGILNLKTSNDPVLQEDVSAPSGLLPALKVKQDLDCYKMILKQVYAGVNHYKSIDFMKRVDQVISNVSGDMSVENLLTTLFKIHEGAIDSHFMLFARTELGSSCNHKGNVVQNMSCQFFESAVPYRLPYKFIKIDDSIYEAVEDPSIRIVSCEGLKAAKILSPSSVQQYIFVDQEVEMPKKVQCKMAGNEQRIFELRTLNTPNPNSQKYSRSENSSMISVRVPEMTSITPELQEFLNTVKSTSTTKSILIDIRHNGGGENDFAEALERAVKSDKTPLLSLSKAVKGGLLSYTSFANYFYGEWKGRFDDGLPGGISKDNFFTMLGLLHDLKDEGTFENVVESISVEPKGFGARASFYDKPIMILFDKQCASACESILDRLKMVPNVVFVGTPSYGATHISQAGRLWLPNSKVGVSAGFERWIYPAEIDVPEGFGHEPDFYIDEADPESALDLAKTKLIELAK
jgi:hypothetical protein